MIKRMISDKRGSFAIYLGVCLPLLVGAAGVAADFTYMGNSKQMLQAAADGAALTGATELLNGRLLDADVVAKSKDFLEVNFGATEADVQVDRVKGEVTVVARHDHVLFFGGVLGLPKTSQVSASATAALVQHSEPCILTLLAEEPRGIQIIGASKIKAANCEVWSNSKKAESIYAQGGMNLELNSQRTCAVGGVYLSGPFKLNPEPEANCPPAPDPFGSFSYKMDQPCTFSNATYSGSKLDLLTLSPGVYCGGLQIDGRTTLLMPGIYEMRDGPFRLMNNTSLDLVAGASVTLVFTGTSPGFSLEGGSKAKLTASVSGPFKGMAMVSLPSDAIKRTSSMSGNAELKLETGSLYMRNHYLSMQGNSQLKLKDPSGKLVVGSLGVLGGLLGNPDLEVDNKGGSLSGGQVLLVR